MKIFNPLAFILVLAAISSSAHAAFVQQGNKLVATGTLGTASQGSAVSVSADGNTALIGGQADNTNVGAVWVFTRNGGVWTQQGGKLVGTGAVGASAQGLSVSLSADGNTALLGASRDNGGVGAAWVFTRTGGVWSQQGAKLVGTGATGTLPAQQGTCVSLSADGNTALIGGDKDNTGVGAAWVFTRSGGVWTQHGVKLVGTGFASLPNQGRGVALSPDGNTALIGGYEDNVGVGATWVFTRSAGVWGQQGAKLVGTGAVGAANQGQSVSLSADGNTGMIGGTADNDYIGAVWVFTRNAGVWTQQGPKLVGSGYTAQPLQGQSVSLSADGNTAAIGGHYDNVGFGAAWVFTRSGGVWTQQGSKLMGAGNVSASFQGVSVSLSADAKTLLVGGPTDNTNVGAVWPFSIVSQFVVAAPASAIPGTSFPVTVTARDSTNVTASGYVGTVQFNSTDGAASLPPNYTFVAADAGVHTFSVTLNIAGTSTLTAKDTVATTITGTSPNIVVNFPVLVGPATLPGGTVNQAGYNQVVAASGGTGTLTLNQTGTLPPGLSFTAATGVISGAPSMVGTFNFTITATDTLAATGSQAYSLLIERATAAVTLGSLTQTFDGSPKFATATTNPINLPVILTYNGSPTAPANVGSYTVIGTISDANFQGSASGTLNISNPNITTLMSGPSAAPSPGVVLQSISFSAAAANANSEPLAYNWAFGDGTQAAGASVAHVYASPATYTVTLTVTSSAPTVTASIQATINPRIATVGTGADSDGDGFSDALEGSAGSDPADPESTPTGDPADPGTPDVLTVTKAAVKLNFAKPGNDSISAAGTVDVPAGFISSGAKVYLDVGGVIKGFVLTASGSAGNKTETIKIAIKSKKGVVAAQTAKFTASFKKGSFAEALASSGLTDSTAKNAPVVLPFTFIFNNSVLQTNLPMSYTAKPGKTGAAK